jgi:ABC-2 type transport system permease protein
MPSFSRDLKWELHKLFARPRTPAGFALLLAFQAILLALLHHGGVREEVRSSIVRLGFTFQENFTGATVAALMVGNTMTVLGALQVALVAGEIVSREIEDGTMRMLLCRPIRRGRVLLVKIITALIFTCAITSFITVCALALGMLSMGPGYWLIHSPKEDFIAHHEFWPGLTRFLAASAMMTVSNWTVACLAFMLSCLNVKPAAAAVAALAVLIVDDTLRNLPFFAAVKPHFVMTHIVAWIHVYERRVPWNFLLQNYSALLVLNAAFLAVGWFSFQRRDLKP